MDANKAADETHHWRCPMHARLTRPREPEERDGTDDSGPHGFSEVFFWRRFAAESSRALHVEAVEIGGVDGGCDDDSKTHAEEGESDLALVEPFAAEDDWEGLDDVENRTLRLELRKVGCQVCARLTLKKA